MRSRVEFSKNNFDCLRLILASIVVFYHVYELTSLRAFLVFHKYLSAHFAVRSFFVISGLLIYRSYTRSSSASSYFEKRARRIYPAYFTVVVVAALAFWLLSALPASRYFGIGFWKYLGANLLFLNFLAPSLPGVFSAASSSAVNGALWTLKIEVAFYLMVPLIHFLSQRFGTGKVITILFGLSCVWKYGFAALATVYHLPSVFGLDPSRSLFDQLDSQFPAQLAYFLAGIFLLLYFDKLKSHFLLILSVSCAFFLLDHRFAHGRLDLLWLPGIIFVFGFWRYLGNFSKYGDFSYGVYIVHWPILQVLILFGLARLNPILFLGISVVLVFAAAFLMWHLVEKRFLASSSHYLAGSTEPRRRTLVPQAQ